jgi:signal transduction histidine kinase
VVVILLGTLGVLAPFASVPLPQYAAFIPALEIAVFIPSLITSILLFAQFSLFRSYALLTIATGYLFVALIVISHAAVFPGAIAPTGVLYGGLQSSTWLFVLWQTGFSLTLLVYALLRGKKRPKVLHPTAAIVWSVAIIFGLVCGFIWVAVVGYEYLPSFNLDITHPSGLLRYIARALLIIYVLAFSLLWIRRRSVLDQWLMVVACTAVAQIAFIGLFGATRFSLGFYAGRSFSLLGSTILLVVLVAEMARLYTSLARSNAMLQRERNNKLMTLEAIASSISHELRQPLTAIGMNGETALEFLGNSSPNINEARSALKDIIDDTGRVGRVIDSVRALFGRPSPEKQAVDVNEIVLQVLRSLRKELKNYVTSTGLAADAAHWS